MKNWTYSWALLLAVFISPLEARADWQKLDSGLHYQALSIQNPVASGQKAPPPILIHAFKVDPAKYAIKPFITSSVTDAPNAVKSNGALLAVNANFFDERNRALGLVIKDSKTLSPFKNVSWWGVLAFEKARAWIVHSSEYRARASITNAIQAGPRLLANGVTPPKIKNQLSRKTAIGINRDGMVLFIVTKDYMSTLDFAKILAKPEKQGGLGCVHALNLDGGSSTQAYARVGGFEFNLPTFAKVPVFLGVFKR